MTDLREMVRNALRDEHGLCVAWMVDNVVKLLHQVTAEKDAKIAELYGLLGEAVKAVMHVSGPSCKLALDIRTVLESWTIKERDGFEPLLETKAATEQRVRRETLEWVLKRSGTSLIKFAAVIEEELRRATEEKKVSV